MYDARQRRLYECLARARDHFAAVRPALARLASSLSRPIDPRVDVELAAADVRRVLVHARRSVRALSTELQELDAEARDLIALAARVGRG